jgi:ankyrin repeat protein
MCRTLQTVIPFFAGGHAEVVRMLLEAGADANVKQSGLVTPLHLAAKGFYCF